MKIITFYLPQFHEIPENNEWWGKGFTEWVNVKKAKPLFAEHYQPRIPKDRKYYNLLDINTIKWQVDLAKKSGIYGFCFYHYWFDGHMLLEKPVELFLKNKDINFKYCLSWANEDWTNAWVSHNTKTLISQTYGKQDEWKRHFDYLKKFFLDERYIKINGKPLMIIYRPEIIPCLNDMLDYWSELARKEGLEGISFAYQHVNFGLMKKKDDSRFDFQIEYQPSYVITEMKSRSNSMLRNFKKKIDIFSQTYFHRTISLSNFNKNVETYNYDEMWNRILSRRPDSEKNVPGAFVDWDNTPRRGNKGSLMVGTSPEKFETYLRKQIKRARNVYNKDMLFMFAWNEWAEGGYLEPDERYGTAYLDAIKNALIETNENE